MTLGYGTGWDAQGRCMPSATYRPGGTDQRQWYTTCFGGTSSASPIVAGAAAAVQGVRRARGLPLLSSFRMRELLRDTGVAQAAGHQVGPLPNLREAIALYVNNASSAFTQYGTPDWPYRTLAGAVGDAWSQAQIKIRSGTYAEALTIATPMTLMSTGGTVIIAP